MTQNHSPETSTGYVLYLRDRNRISPFGVVSLNEECQAYTNSLPPEIKSYLIRIEDRNFYKHQGIDIKAIIRSLWVNIQAGKIKQGGSTITQQLARNLLKDNRRSFHRKLKEICFALELESKFSKDEILEAYFNNVYFGNNLRGIRAASLTYFHKEPKYLSLAETLYLLTLLRGPNIYRNHPGKSRLRFQMICKILYDGHLISKKTFKKTNQKRIKLKEYPLEAIRPACLNYITNSVQEENQSILTSIDGKLQKALYSFVKLSRYPVSVVAVRNAKVIAFASTYGTDYPFIYRSNVGSTLKPFIYTYLRENGINSGDLFSSTQNEMKWPVNEVIKLKDRAKMTLKEALLFSNNNTFINASLKVGLDSVLDFLAQTISKPRSDLYPSSILGATRGGISLAELSLIYSSFFNGENSSSKKECFHILNDNFKEKIGINIDCAFLKTGTTNDYKDKYVVLGDGETTFAFLSNEYDPDDTSKEGGLIASIGKYIRKLFKPKSEYKWI